jgi:hypothetical protein
MKHHQFQYSLILTASLCLTAPVSWGQNGSDYKGITGNTSDMVKSTISNTVSGAMQSISGGMGTNTLANSNNISNVNRNINPFTGYEITVEEKERLIAKQRLDSQIIEEQIHQKELRNKYEVLDLKKLADIATIKASIKTASRDLNGGGNYNGSFYEGSNNSNKSGKSSKKSGKTKIKYNKNIDNDTSPVVISPLPKIDPVVVMTPPSSTQLLPPVFNITDVNDGNSPKILGVVKKNGKWQALVDFKGKVNSVSSGKSVGDDFSIDEVSANTVKANGKVTKIEKKLSKLPNEITPVISKGNGDLGGFLPSSPNIPQPIMIPGLK